VRQLHLLRHAKSSWDDPALPDHDRPLSPRGRKAARRLARWLDAHEVRPQLVLCSPALRATQTLDRVLSGLGSPEVVLGQELYHASVHALLSRVRALPDAVGEAAVVGHNPGLADLCLLLARPGPDRDRVADNLPTGALATIELDTGSWSDIAPGCAELVRVVLPRELA
jgi:phosphohistidine phosphatase